MENNNRLQMDGIQNEKNTKWSKIKQIMLKELMNFAVVIVILAVVLVIVNIAFPNLKNRAYVWYYNLNHPYKLTYNLSIRLLNTSNNWIKYLQNQNV